MVTYINDAAGRVTSMTYPDNQVVSYGYDSSNAVTSVDIQQHSNSSPLIIAEYEYDNMGRLTDVLLGDGGLTTYQYDDIGRLDRHTLADFHITTLGYNPANQIIRRSVTDSTMQTALPNSSPDLYTPNNLNQYTSVDSGIPLEYDDNGNLTKYDGWDYGYDAHNRMQSATGPGSTSLNLTYDPTGRLSSTQLQGSTTSFSYSGNQLIGEYEQLGNSINLTELYVYAPGSDIPLARFSDGSIGSNSVTYLRADERGSIVLETDGTSILESHQYDAYGVPLNVSDSLFRYTGQIQLKGTELYHYKARAYHPELGRFMQTDPIGYDDGMNMYAYVGNDPVNGVDPSGMAFLDANKVIHAMFGLHIKKGTPPEDTQEDYGITDAQRTLLAEGSRKEFWESRAEQGDPLAEIALESIANDSGYLVGGIAINRRLQAFSRVYGDGTVDLNEVGIKIMRAHAGAIDADKLGIPGLLSPRQAAAYHHDVFAEYGLPKTTFGGTPWTGSMWELPITAYFPIVGWCWGCDGD